MKKAVKKMLSPDEQLLVNLRALFRSPDDYTRTTSMDLVKWYIRHHSWTGAQRYLARRFCEDKCNLEIIKAFKEDATDRPASTRSHNTPWY